MEILRTFDLRGFTKIHDIFVNVMGILSLPMLYLWQQLPLWVVLSFDLLFVSVVVSPIFFTIGTYFYRRRLMQRLTSSIRRSAPPY